MQPGSFADVVNTFYASDKFKKLAPSTQSGYRRYLNMAAHPDVLGGRQVHELKSSLVYQFLEGLAHIPGAQQLALVAIKSMEEWALPREIFPWPITYGVKVAGPDGHHKPWTDREVMIAREFSRPDIARIITLAALTGQRGSDLCRMRWSDIETIQGQAGINVIQQKTGLKLWVPILPELQTELDKWDRRVPDFMLLRWDNKPWPNRHNMSEAWIRERDRNVRLKPVRDLVLHGLRGHAVVRLRRAGLTPLQVADMVGMSVPMIEVYCKLADQKQSALAAVAFLDQHRTLRNRKSGPKGS